MCGWQGVGGGVNVGLARGRVGQERLKKELGGVLRGLGQDSQKEKSGSL
jgi:hypothetical protein